MDKATITPPIEKKPSEIPTKETVPSKETKVPEKTEEVRGDVKKEKPQEKEEELTPQELAQPYQTSELFYEVANLLSVEAKDFETARDQLSVITDYAIQEAKSTKVEDIMLQIRKIEDSIQKPSWGERRYTNLYRYIRLASRKQSIEKAMGAFNR